MRDYRLELFLYKEDIEEGISNLAKDLNKEYINKELIILSILKGAFIFTSDLIQKLSILINYELYFCKCSSYTEQQKGELKIELPDLDFKNKNILILDDIHDTGETIDKISSKIKEAKTVKSAVVINRITDNKISNPDYRLIDCEGNNWFVGYGMDLNEKYRGLQDIYKLIS